jgi:hypothetical protein
MKEFDFDFEQWADLQMSLEFLIRNSKSHWTVDTISSDYEVGPYIQARYDGGTIYAEITSNKYLRPQIDAFLHPFMWELGWLSPLNVSFPNFNFITEYTIDGHEKLARVCIRTLVEVYGMKQDWEFTFTGEEIRL